MDRRFDARSFGASGDGVSDDTKAIQAAVDACAGSGGGTVTVPSGTYRIGPVFLRSDITLCLEAGSVLRGTSDVALFPAIDSRWEGSTRRSYAPLIGGQGLRNVAVIGRGVIDGGGETWWRLLRAGALAYPRPRLVSFSDCSDVLLEGISLRNSPSWTVNPVRCENVVIRGITVWNPADSPNTDGINADSCGKVRITGCYVSVGDDCIAVKSGTEKEEPALRAPSSDILISDCVLEKGHGGIVVGSEMSGGVYRVAATNCVFNGTDRGIRLKSRRGRGGIVEDVRISNAVMNDVLCPFTVNLYYGCGAWGDPVVSDKGARPVDDGTPRIRGINITGMTARGVKYAAAFVYGLKEMPVEDVTLRDVRIILAGDSEGGYPEMADGIEAMRGEGFFARYVRGLRLDGVEITGQRGAAFRVEDSEDVVFRYCGESAVSEKAWAGYPP